MADYLMGSLLVFVAGIAVAVAVLTVVRRRARQLRAGRRPDLRGAKEFRLDREREKD